MPRPRVAPRPPVLHGLLGTELMAQYCELVQPRRRRAVASGDAELPRHSSACGAWGGLGGQLIISQLATGRVTAALWSGFERVVSRTRHADLYEGVAGALPVLAVVAAAQGRRGRRLTRFAAEATAKTLERRIAEARRGRAVSLGFAHGVAGLLAAHELGNALLGRRESPVRAASIELLLKAETGAPGGLATWPARVNAPRSPVSPHALCNGAPGIGLAATLAFRYSAATAYAPLIERAMSSVAVHTADESFCCGTLGRVETLIELFRTAGDRRALHMARELFAQVDASRFRDETWQRGTMGYRFARLRLSHPFRVDLPGFPLRVGRL